MQNLKTMKTNEAKIQYPNYEDYPNIHHSGSLRGMKKLYGWDTSKVIKVGNYYYYLNGHPNMS